MNNVKVWITGAGIVTALGRGLNAHISALEKSKTGLARHDFFDGNPPDPCICGKVPEDIVNYSIEESASDRANLLLENAVAQSLDYAGIETPVKADLIAGTTLGNMHGGTLYYKKIREDKAPDIKLIKDFLPCAPAVFISKKYGFTGKKWTVASACGSGAAAIGHAFRRIRGCKRERILAGGFEVLSPFVVAGFNSLQLVSKQECKPFDRDRNGLNPGEGAAVLILESRETALARGAESMAEIKGFGDALDAYHHTRAHPEGEGLVKAISKALKEADLSPGEIDNIHLHGTGTIVNDNSEYVACKKIFGEYLSSIPICSSKPMTGHTFGASGAVNAVFSIISLKKSIIPATLFHENIDPVFKDFMVCCKPQSRREIRNILTTSLGFGGEAFALVISKAD